jgi:hypothetical protein
MLLWGMGLSGRALLRLCRVDGYFGTVTVCGNTRLHTIHILNVMHAEE